MVGAYKRLYIDVESNSARSAAVSVSRNLMALVATATVGELASLEKMVSELVASKVSCSSMDGFMDILWIPSWDSTYRFAESLGTTSSPSTLNFPFTHLLCSYIARASSLFSFRIFPYSIIMVELILKL